MMGYGPSAGGYGASMDMTPPDHYLLRFFDFTVASGKSYVYRVRLRMRNPNWMFQSNQLADPSLGDEEFIYGEWSGITDAARVPGNNALVSGEATDVAGIGKALRAGTNCGSCLPELKKIVALQEAHHGSYARHPAHAG